MDFKTISTNFQTAIIDLFSELTSGMSQREDSRAFGAMIEKRITANWQ